MPIHYGSGNNQAAIYHGTTEMTRVYKGAQMVWQKLPGWTPLNMSNLYAWYDADQQTQADNTSITQLTDRSGNGRHAAGSGNGDPLLKHNVLNGRKVIQLGENTSGVATTTLYGLPTGFLSGFSAVSMYYVFKAHAEPSSAPYDGALFGGIENHTGDTHIPYSDSNCYTGFGSTTRRTFNPSPSLTSWRIWHEHSASNDWAAWIDGATVSTSGTNTVSVPSGTSPSFGTGRAGSTLAPWRGQMAEAVFISAKSSQSDREALEGYLAHKWGLIGNLPGGHPYITNPPIP